jgi:hypothetical protein
MSENTMREGYQRSPNPGQKAHALYGVAMPVLLLSLALLATPTSSEAELRSSYARLTAARAADDVCSPPELWEVIERWALTVLDGEAGLTGEALARSVEALEDSPDADARVLNVTAVRLDEQSFAVTFNYDAHGLVEVLTRDAKGPWRVGWSIAELARPDLAQRKELGRWAWCERGFHDGALTGRVLEAPRSGAGLPRFLVWAHANPMMGGDWPTQLSLWTWDGHEARPQFVGGARFAVDYEWDFRRDGSRLEVHTKEPMKSFFACGSCEELESVWRLDLEPEGLKDLGREPLTTELALADELIDRVRRGAGKRSALERSLAVLLREAPARPASLGMPSWSVSGSGAQTTVLHLSADELDPIDFTISTVNGVRTVTAVARSCPDAGR